MRPRIHILIYILMSVLDTAMTILFFNRAMELKMGFYIWQYENNPIAGRVIKYYGIEGMLWYKTILVIIAILCICGFYRKYPNFTISFMYGANFVTGLACLTGVICYAILW